ncbi:MAG: HNH endonuclease [Kurthia sp.]|nr:HNH endonuclease [Candidatus Kurthia equi]
MKKYYELSSGVYNERQLIEAEIWCSVQKFFYHGKNATSYKFIFFKALIENIADVTAHNEVTFKKVFDSFTAIAWNLVACHHLEQSSMNSKKAAVQRIIEDFQKSYDIPDEWSYEKINLEQREVISKQIKRVGKVNVVGATFGDFNEEIYSFDKKTEIIKMNPLYIEFILKYKRMLVDVNNYQFALYLDKNNSSEKGSGLLAKIETVSKRSSLKEFEVILRQTGVNECFYCQKKIISAHVDHFIPWSYVQNDCLWNFVLACPSCNTKKSDKLAHETYLHLLIERNKKLRVQKNCKIYFESYHEDKLIKSYKYAQQNGFKRL